MSDQGDDWTYSEEPFTGGLHIGPCPECAALSSRLAVATDALREIAQQQPRTLANLRSHGVVFDGPLTADPSNWQDVAFTIYTDLCEADSIARAALGVVTTTGEEKP